MKTTKFLIALGLLLIFSQLFAQDPAKITNNHVNDNPGVGKSAQGGTFAAGGAINDITTGGTTGSAYLNREWQEGVIIMNDKSVITGNKFRYNIYTQQMLFIKDGDTMAIANPEEISLLRFANKQFIYIDYLYNGELKQGYFELLKEGECSLLKRWVVSYHVVESDAQQRLSSSGENEEFIRECNCFLKFGDQPAVALENRKKDFIACFGKNGKNIEAYMRNSRLKYKTQQDLYEIVAYYNEFRQ
jgi:hypothetical protein